MTPPDDTNSLRYWTPTVELDLAVSGGGSALAIAQVLALVRRVTNPIRCAQGVGRCWGPSGVCARPKPAPPRPPRYRGRAARRAKRLTRNTPRAAP